MIVEVDQLIKKITEEVCSKLAAETCNVNNKPSAHKGITSMISHTLLKPCATKDQVIKLCEEAKEYKFASVCINSYYVPLAYEILKGTGINVCTVVGFPLGATTTNTKVQETNESIENGATEIEMVINIGALKSEEIIQVKDDIESVVIAAKGKAKTTVIIETCLLTDEEKVKACAIAKAAGAEYVKTCTGFNSGRATVEDITLMRKAVGAEIGVTAYGGVKDYQTAVAMVNAGANRLGTSSGVAIVRTLG